jgi:hypothetical protein
MCRVSWSRGLSGMKRRRRNFNSVQRLQEFRPDLEGRRSDLLNIMTKTLHERLEARIARDHAGDFIRGRLTLEDLCRNAQRLRSDLLDIVSETLEERLERGIAGDEGDFLGGGVALQDLGGEGEGFRGDLFDIMPETLEEGFEAGVALEDFGGEGEGLGGDLLDVVAEALEEALEAGIAGDERRGDFLGGGVGVGFGFALEELGGHGEGCGGDLLDVVAEAFEEALEGRVADHEGCELDGGGFAFGVGFGVDGDVLDDAEKNVSMV